MPPPETETETTPENAVIPPPPENPPQRPQGVNVGIHGAIGGLNIDWDSFITPDVIGRLLPEIGLRPVAAILGVHNPGPVLRSLLGPSAEAPISDIQVGDLMRIERPDQSVVYGVVRSVGEAADGRYCTAAWRSTPEQALNSYLVGEGASNKPVGALSRVMRHTWQNRAMLAEARSSEDNFHAFAEAHGLVRLRNISQVRVGMVVQRHSLDASHHNEMFTVVRSVSGNLIYGVWCSTIHGPDGAQAYAVAVVDLSRATISNCDFTDGAEYYHVWPDIIRYPEDPTRWSQNPVTHIPGDLVVDRNLRVRGDTTYEGGVDVRPGNTTTFEHNAPSTQISGTGTRPITAPIVSQPVNLVDRSQLRVGMLVRVHNGEGVLTRSSPCGVVALVGRVAEYEGNEGPWALWRASESEAIRAYQQATSEQLQPYGSGGQLTREPALRACFEILRDDIIRTEIITSRSVPTAPQPTNPVDGSQLRAGMLVRAENYYGVVVHVGPIDGRGGDTSPWALWRNRAEDAVRAYQTATSEMLRVRTDGIGGLTRWGAGTDRVFEILRNGEIIPRVPTVPQNQPRIEIGMTVRRNPMEVDASEYGVIAYVGRIGEYGADETVWAIWCDSEAEATLEYRNAPAGAFAPAGTGAGRMMLESPRSCSVLQNSALTLRHPNQLQQNPPDAVGVHRLRRGMLIRDARKMIDPYCVVAHIGTLSSYGNASCVWGCYERSEEAAILRYNNTPVDSMRPRTDDGGALTYSSGAVNCYQIVTGLATPVRRLAGESGSNPGVCRYDRLRPGQLVCAHLPRRDGGGSDYGVVVHVGALPEAPPDGSPEGALDSAVWAFWSENVSAALAAYRERPDRNFVANSVPGLEGAGLTNYTGSIEYGVLGEVSNSEKRGWNGVRLFPDTAANLTITGSQNPPREPVVFADISVGDIIEEEPPSGTISARPFGVVVATEQDESGHVISITTVTGASISDATEEHRKYNNGVGHASLPLRDRYIGDNHVLYRRGRVTRSVSEEPDVPVRKLRFSPNVTENAPPDER